MNELLNQFWAALKDQRNYLESPTIPHDDPIFCIRTRPGFIFDDEFWTIFHAHPLAICHVAYYGPERLEEGDRTADKGIFELRFVPRGYKASTPQPEHLKSRPGCNECGMPETIDYGDLAHILRHSQPGERIPRNVFLVQPLCGDVTEDDIAWARGQLQASTSPPAKEQE